MAEASSHWRSGLHGGLWIVNIETPAAPLQVGFYNLGTAGWGVAVSGGYAYVADQYGLQVIDVSDPSAPATGGFSGVSHASDVKVVGRYAYVTNPEGVRVIDVGHPAVPIELAFFATPAGATDVAVAEGYVYVAATDGGLFVLRYEEPSAPWRTWLPVILRP